ncbi:hypothetical protein ORV05_17135 [Amycolatopsis cynarae]|uniref:Heavy metal transporter n=1 Tax=Amycolatopsis cynarae TaxID=2995223 RepID=A0ABY7BE39_9PSEU|nr:hypothetical protein [Amycolatopsis sp. HUAS 11-8]WAL69418.1 hypothetical protein ORV05_17135 [Amycolatopsis sp. HUAS 11-8]
MRIPRWGLVVLVLAVVAGGTVWLVLSTRRPPAPGCTVASADNADHWALGPDQAQNAATIAGVGLRSGMPNHAVTVALATAFQESKLRNLTGGDLDSAGLFQQRPSQGWGTYAQVTDPVHASESFFRRLRAQPNWAQLTVTQAAQLVQRSAAPGAYAQWEAEARALAGALTGETPAALTCHNLVLTPSATDLAATAAAELGTSALSGAHERGQGWSLASWLVANAVRFGIDRIAFDGQTWTAATGAWTGGGPADGTLSLHRLPLGT